MIIFNKIKKFFLKTYSESTFYGDCKKGITIEFSCRYDVEKIQHLDANAEKIYF